MSSLQTAIPTRDPIEDSNYIAKVCRDLLNREYGEDGADSVVPQILQLLRHELSIHEHSMGEDSPDQNITALRGCIKLLESESCDWNN